MNAILIDVEVAREIAHALRWGVTGNPGLDAFHRALADILLTAPDSEESAADAQVRKEVTERLLANERAQHPLISISAHDGNIHLRGTTPSEEYRRRICMIAQAVPGVKAVHDHLMWMDRASGAFLLSSEDSAPG
jgi:osmotically-inducible protein OsmY